MTGWGMIEALAEDEGDSVQVLCPNPDGPPNYAIEVQGEWTNWNCERFEGNTRLECLSNAVEAMRAKKGT